MLRIFLYSQKSNTAAVFLGKMMNFRPKKIAQHIFLCMHAKIAQEGVIDQNIEKSLIVPTISGFPMGHVLSEPGLGYHSLRQTPVT